MIKLFVLVHFLDLFFGPDSLEVVYLELGSCGHHPPEHVHSHMGFRIIVEVILFAVLTFKVIHVTLIIVYTLELLLKQFESEVCEQDALDKCKYASDEGVRVAWLVHVILGPRCRKQVVESEKHK